MLHFEDPVSDNVSANLIGLALGTLARFWGLRHWIFKQPVHVPELVHGPVTSS